MIIRTHFPPPPLSDFVEMFWLYEGFTQPAKERALPTGTVELVISLRDDRLQVFDRHSANYNFRGAMICGPHSEFFVTDSAKDESVLGVHFINDFQAFSGLNPTAYLAHSKKRNPNHVPISSLNNGGKK